jgi:ribosomal protein S18 acetylase RimI-like enzyme
MSIRVRTLDPQEWRLWRELRLQALRDAPDAFGDTLTLAAVRPEADWRRALASRTGPFLMAEVGDEPAGMARAAEMIGDPSSAGLYSMWVLPRYRGAGVGQALVDAAVAWARDAGWGRIALYVTLGNDGAKRLYSRSGFVDTGRRIELRPDSELEMEEMVRVLAT